MKSERLEKILEIVRNNEVGTQEELVELLIASGQKATQATVSRDIRQLKLRKHTTKSGKTAYFAPVINDAVLNEKYVRVFRDGYVSMDMAMNILVIKTVSGMAMAVAAAIDAMNFTEIVGSIAGDDTIMCAIRSIDETKDLMDKLKIILEKE